MDRRNALKGAAAVMAAAHLRAPDAHAAEATSASGRLYDLKVPEQALEALVKMRGDLTGGEVPWY